MSQLLHLRHVMRRYWVYICVPACVLWIVWTYSSVAAPFPKSPFPEPYIGCDTTDTIKYKSPYKCGNGWLSDTLRISMPLSCRGNFPDTFTVNYCFPDPLDSLYGIYPKEQYVIRAITGLKDTCTFTATEMREIGRKLMELNPQCFPCSMICNPLCEAHPECPCPALYPEWRASWTSCFRKFVVYGENDDTLSFGFAACDAAGVCIDVYHVCCKIIDSTTYQVKPHLVASAYTEECKTKQGIPIYGCYPVCPGPPDPPNPPLPPCTNGIIGGSPDMSEKVQPEQKNNTSKKTKKVVTQQPPKGSRQEQQGSNNTIPIRQQQK